jgi:hypothetical protein
MVNCFRPRDEAGQTKECLRAKWYSRVGMLVPLLGEELAQKFLEDVVFQDEVGKFGGAGLQSVRAVGARASLPDATGGVSDLVLYSPTTITSVHLNASVNRNRLVIDWVHDG